MKLILGMALLTWSIFVSQTAEAQRRPVIDCPKGTSIAYKCTPNLQPGDDEQLEAFEEALLCEIGSGNHGILLYGLSGTTPIMEAVERSDAEYTHYVATQESLEISLSFRRDKNLAHSKLQIVNLPTSQKLSATFACVAIQ